MTNEIWITVFGLGLISFLIRISGFILASHLPKHGTWARGLEALPGCLIASLVTLMMIYGSTLEWITGIIVLTDILDLYLIYLRRYLNNTSMP